jgi:hypothetical protein
LKPAISNEPHAPNPSWARWTRIPFPSYRYVPGALPHPHRDAEGHSYGKREEVHRPWSPPEWRTLERYLYGIDLYNYGYFWEAHESLEALWKAAQRDSIQGRFIQGLIQIAAGNLHRYMGHKINSLRQAEKGLTHLGVALREGPIYMGIAIEEFSHRARAYAGGRILTPPPIELISDDGGDAIP